MTVKLAENGQRMTAQIVWKIRLPQKFIAVWPVSRRPAFTQPLAAKLSSQMTREHRNSAYQACATWIFPSTSRTSATPEAANVNRLSTYRRLIRMAGPRGSTSRLTMAWMLPHIHRRRCLKYAFQVQGEVSSMYSWNQPQRSPAWAALQ